MFKKMNNKGYMLIEIILAFALAFGVMYFMMDMVINLKNKNDDLLVKTLIYSDQAIVSNKIMEHLIEDTDGGTTNNFSCDFISVDGQVVKYNDEVINIIDDYATVSYDSSTNCSIDELEGNINITIPVDVKQQSDENFDIVIAYKYSPKVSFAVFSEDTGSLKFYNRGNMPKVGGTYDGEAVTKVYTGFEAKEYLNAVQIPWYNVRDKITKIEIIDEITPVSTAYWFNGLNNVSYIDVSKINSDELKKMNYMFNEAGSNVSSFKIVGLENFDTSKVIDMSNVLSKAGQNATTFNIGDLSGWDVSNVTNMIQMFYSAGEKATTFNIGDLSKKEVTRGDGTTYTAWNTSKVTTMIGMFDRAGQNATTFKIGDLSGWNVSYVTEMGHMFYSAGQNATTFNIGDLSGWDTSSVIDMNGMFYGVGKNATTFNIGDLSGWDTSKVTDMNYMFGYAGAKVNEFNIGDLSKKEVTRDDGTTYTAWNTSEVKNMAGMFAGTGAAAVTFDIGDISNWDVSNVKNMGDMFFNVAFEATTFKIGDISKWDTTSVTDMNEMFVQAAFGSSNWSLNLSGWNVDMVTKYDKFNLGAESKVTAPIWVN